MATVVACLAVAGAAAVPASAVAEQTVVSATIFTGTSGAYSSQPVLLSTLASPACATYAGPSWTYPNGQAPLTTGTAWSLGEILNCALGTTQDNVTAVKVFNGDSNAYQNTLTAAEVFNSDTYPSGALPLISVDGTTTSGGSVTYTRPPTGPADQAQSDQFTEDGTSPVAIEVFENQLPLNVTAAPVYGASNGSSQTVTLGATVAGADGATIDPSQLTWSWTFDGSPAGNTAAPTVTVGAGDSELASVIVTDQATGASGTQAFAVTYNPSPAPPAAGNGAGAGSSPKGGQTGQGDGKKHSDGKTKKLKDGGGLEHAGSNKSASKVHTRRGSKTGSHSGTTTPPVSTPSTTPPPSSQPPAISAPPAAAPTAPPASRTPTSAC